MSGVVEKIKDKVQQATHSGPYAKEGDAAHTGTAAAGTHTTGTHTTGTHHTGTGIGSTGTHTTGTGIGSTGTHTTGTGIGSTSTNAGPHDSNLANKLDPRVDSDRDGSRTAGTGAGAGLAGTTGTHTGTGLTSSHHTTGTHTGTGLAGTTGTHSSSTTAGPHSSNIANKLDPRVDSDRDGSNTLGSNTGTGYGSTGYGSTAGTGLGSHSGLGSTGAGYGSATGSATGTAGPHSSNLLNKADPRVDSDLDGSRNAGAAGGFGGAGYGTTGTHSTGIGSTTGTHSTGFGTTGTHNTGVGHSGVGGTTGSGLTGSHSGPGPAPNTAGPHSSDMLNKVDPRVDSDLDGSKTVGGNATYQSDVPATDTSDTFTKSIDAAFRNDSVQKPTYHQADGAADDLSSGQSTPPDAAKHTPEKFKEKQLRRGSITLQDLDDNEEYRREHLAGNEFKEALEKYGSGTK